MERYDGTILICDDNVLNQQELSEHLAEFGVQTVTADNGLMGVALVKERKEKGEPPFDLILMDVFMPVMDGVTATKEILEFGSETPIIAMIRPFTSEELESLLQTYLKPENQTAELEKQEYDPAELLNELKIMFVKNNITKYDEIIKAIKFKDKELVYRLVHGIKASAGFIGKTKLAKVATEIEMLFKDCAHFEMPNIPDKLLNNFKTELYIVLYELQPLLDEAKSKPVRPTLNNTEIITLFEKLEPLLKYRNSECFDLLDEVRAVPGGEKLAGYIEKFNFKAALIAMEELRLGLGL